MSNKKPTVIISTDGSCLGNPGPGGYAAIMRFGKHEKKVCGYEAKTTNNRMELQALISAVKKLKCPCNVTVRTDSQYVCFGLNNAEVWAKNNWKSKTGAHIANEDMWRTFLDLKHENDHSFYYVQVAGHSGDPDNELCDKLAKEQIATGGQANAV